MHSIKSVFLVIFWICSTILMDESSKDKICSDTLMTIDSAIVPLDQHFVYLTSQDFVYKMDIKNADQLEIYSVKTLKNWSPDIKPTIDVIQIDRSAPQALILINCQQTMRWTIRYDDNTVLDSRRFPGCVHDFEHITDPGSGNDIVLQYYPLDNKMTVDYKFPNETLKWKSFTIRCLTAETNKIRLNDESGGKQLPDTELFYQINGAIIKAAFIYNRNWYLFADRYYCRVGLNEHTFEECKPIAINTLIKDCDEETESENKPKQNKDFSMYVIVVFIIIAIAVITIVVIALIIYREAQKTTSKAQGSSVVSSTPSY